MRRRYLAVQNLFGFVIKGTPMYVYIHEILCIFWFACGAAVCKVEEPAGRGTRRGRTIPGISLILIFSSSTAEALSIATSMVLPP